MFVYCDGQPCRHCGRLWHPPFRRLCTTDLPERLREPIGPPPVPRWVQALNGPPRELQAELLKVLGPVPACEEKYLGWLTDAKRWLREAGQEQGHD